jgi:diguanylate cyclase (GGDEF)-like protein/PAS domain S-box-containing protein
LKSLNFELLLKALNHLDIGTIVIDKSLNIVMWSDWMVGHSEKKTCDVMGHSLLLVCPEINSSRVSEAIINTLHTGQPAVISNAFNRTPFNLYPKKTATQKLVESTMPIQQAVKVKRLTIKGKPQFCQIQITDVSASVKREDSLREQIRNRKKTEKLLSDERALLISGPTVVLTWLTYPKPRIDYISPNIERMLGYTAQQFIQCDLTLLNLIHPDDTKQYLSEIKSNINSDRLVFEQEFRLINASGEYRWVSLLASINKDSSGNFSKYLGYLLDITERKKYQSLVEHQAYYDELTGLPNRRMFINRLEQELDKSRRHQYKGALFFIDIDRFKSINDSLGHEIGDLLLKGIADRLKNCIRLEDTVARLGGDEFVVILSKPADASEDISQAALTVAKKMRSSIDKKFELNGNEVHSTPSIGIVTFPTQDAENAEEFMRFADTAMYRAKNEGGNEIRFFDPKMQIRIDNRLALEKSLRSAIDKEEFVLNFQPLFDNQHRIISAEALIRWQHPQRGWVSPADFIPLAEETGLILYLGDWVLRESCRQLKHWESIDGLYLPKIAVNVSPKQFRQSRFVSQVKKILYEFKVKPERLVIELTEGIVIADVNDTVKKMTALQSLGIRIAIDDFGTGYSSLTYLNTLPIDVLKIDQSFIRDISNNTNTAIVGTIISMAKHLDLNVIAEGVESESELKYLTSAGCNMFQGYFFSKPLSAEVFSKFYFANNTIKGTGKRESKIN